MEHYSSNTLGFPGSANDKEPAYQCRRRQRHEFDPWVGKIPWRRKWQPTPVFLPEESHGQRSLAGYSPQGCKELDTTEGTWHVCTQQLKTTDIYYLTVFVGQKSSTGLKKCHQGCIVKEVLEGNALCPYLRCWPNLAPCGCRTEVPTSLLTIK